MNSDHSSPQASNASPRGPNRVWTPDERAELETTALIRHPLEEQFATLQDQHEAASLGMWIFLATEAMLFGVLFLSLAIYRHSYPLEFGKASEKLNWVIGAINTVVLLVSSLTMVLAVHHASQGQRTQLVRFLLFTAALGVLFLGFKAVEYYLDYVENLIPGWRFIADEWVSKEGLGPEQVPHVKLFLSFYWIMTGLHAVHVSLGIVVVCVMAILSQRGYFSAKYYSPVDCTGLYWHFVDIVWIFLLPMLYLAGSHQ
jgi:cytochrome c oxidase subunit 3